MMNKLNIKSVTIKNYMSIMNIDNLDISGGMIPILGLNGAGKSNILKAINWFSKDDKDTNSIKNKYYLHSSLPTIVEFNFLISNEKSGEQNLIIFKEKLKEVNDYLFDKIKNSASMVGIEKLKNFFEEILNKDQISIRKVYTSSDNVSKTLYKFNKDFSIFENDSDNMSLEKFVNDAIKTIILPMVPKINLLDTKLILRDFDISSNIQKKNNSTILMDEEFEQTNEEEITLAATSSFRDLFRYTFINEPLSDKYKMLSNIFSKIESCKTIEEFASISKESSGMKINMMHSDNSLLKKVQTEFSDLITNDGFFRSINSDINFYIFPEVDGKKIKLSLYDKVKYEDGTTRVFDVDDLSTKNDGFIFALILYLQIEYLLDDNSILLIDEPANFLSTASIKVFMERLFEINNKRGLKFIFTTHSAYTLDKNIVNIRDIIIAKKDQRFHTMNFKIDDNETNLHSELELVKDAYNSNKKGQDLMSEYKNVLFESDSQLNNDLIKVVNNWTNEINLLAIKNPNLLIENIKIYSGLDRNAKEYICSKSKNNSILDIIDNIDIKEIFEEFDINGGEINFKKLNEDAKYKESKLIELFSNFDNNFTYISNLMKNTKKSFNEKLNLFMGK